METPVILQNRLIVADDIILIRNLREINPSWSQYRLSRELANHWNWRNGNGQLKDIACRSLLRKLSAKGLVELPAPRIPSPNRFRHLPVRPVEHDTTPITEQLSSLQPLQLIDVSTKVYSGLFAWLLARYHYLSFKQPVGENIAYLAVDRHSRPLACLLFGSAAWSCAARDQYLGWSAKQRQERLHFLTNNHRFLILPWVNVSCLASHLLGLIAKRISQDWQIKYGHPILALETFVDQRFQGTCYRAANWQRLGQTTGRTRNDRYSSITAPIKNIYMYPLRGKEIHRIFDE